MVFEFLDDITNMSLEEAVKRIEQEFYAKSNFNLISLFRLYINKGTDIVSPFAIKKILYYSGVIDINELNERTPDLGIMMAEVKERFILKEKYRKILSLGRRRITANFFAINFKKIVVTDCSFLIRQKLIRQMLAYCSETDLKWFARMLCGEFPIHPAIKIVLSYSDDLIIQKIREHNKEKYAELEQKQVSN